MPPADVPQVIEALKIACAKKGVQVVPSKCCIHCPACIVHPNQKERDHLEATTGMQTRLDGITLMGTTCQGRYATTLDPTPASPDHPATKRLQRAEELAQAILALAAHTSQTGTTQAAWLLFCRKLPHAHGL